MCLIRFESQKHIDMLHTCNYAMYMSKMIQLRNVPDSLHRKLKSRAALEGLSLSDYLLQEIRRMSEFPTTAELQERIAERTRVKPDIPPGEAVRHERDRR
jgi:antitoxin FitA